MAMRLPGLRPEYESHGERSRSKRAQSEDPLKTTLNEGRRRS
jgi:hypothetical protein